MPGIQGNGKTGRAGSNPAPCSTYESPEEVTMNSLAIAIEDFNTESTQIEHDMAQDGVEYGPNGELVQVDTPWAMGFVDEQGVSLS